MVVINLRSFLFLNVLVNPSKLYCDLFRTANNPRLPTVYKIGPLFPHIKKLPVKETFLFSSFKILVPKLVEIMHAYRIFVANRRIVALFGCEHMSQ